MPAPPQPRAQLLAAQQAAFVFRLLPRHVESTLENNVLTVFKPGVGSLVFRPETGRGWTGPRGVPDAGAAR